jgi:hypothetical protein
MRMDAYKLSFLFSIGRGFLDAYGCVQTQLSL